MCTYMVITQKKEEGWILVGLCISLLFTVALQYYNKKNLNNSDPDKDILNKS